MGTGVNDRPVDGQSCARLFRRKASPTWGVKRENVFCLSRKKTFLLILIWDILHNIFYITVQDLTKHVNLMCTDTFVPFYSGYLPGADMIFVNQRILRNAFIFHCIPKSIVDNHFFHLPIDILTDTGI